MKYTLTILALTLSACLPLAEPNSIYVDYVIDGDSFVTEDGTTVRLFGIDAPEKDEPYYQTATITLESLIEDEALECTFVEKGKYQRDVMRCYVGDDDVAAIMVEKGMAKNYAEFPNDYYLNEEVKAQKYKRGIWSD